MNIQGTNCIKDIESFSNQKKLEKLFALKVTFEKVGF